ncbi:MAG: DUF2029 domain-containing protein [Dehalococcoidales bacterium]|nr:DUF2029 domain-containing protein [Dehalococcoidales bacterium]
MHVTEGLQREKELKLLEALVLALVVLIAAWIRLWAAPLSAGPDVSQFWAFAEVFRQHGLDFYRYAAAKLEIFPFKDWAYVYPPVWLILLGLALLTVPSSLATDQMVDPGWRLAMKVPIIIADLAIGVLIYWNVPRSKPVKMLFACLWLFNPLSWYQSAVFGQFDAIAAAFLLAGVIFVERGRDTLGFLLMALAVMTKQHTLLSVAVVVASLAATADRRRLLKNCALALAAGIVISIPFLVTGNVREYLSSIFFPGQGAYYQYPLVYAFGGVGALLTYLHNWLGWETVGYLKFGVFALAVSFVAVCMLAYFRKISLERGALAGYLLFIAFFYRINYQYLVIFVALALLAAARTSYRSERVLALVLALFPAAWMWLFDNSFWFNYLEPLNPWVRQIFDSLGLVRYNIPDCVFVGFALVLMGLSLAYVLCVFLKWREPLKPAVSLPVKREKK